MFINNIYIDSYNIYYYVLINEFPSPLSFYFNWISHFPSVFLQRYVCLATQTRQKFGDSLISKIWLFAFQNSGTIRSWYLSNAIKAKNILLEPGLGWHDRAGPLSCCCWECKNGWGYSEKEVGRFLEGPALLTLLGIYPGDMKTHLRKNLYATICSGFIHNLHSLKTIQMSFIGQTVEQCLVYANSAIE